MPAGRGTLEGQLKGLVSGSNFNWIHKNEVRRAFFASLVSSSNELGTESIEVKRAKELNNPLTSYRLSIPRVSPRPDSSL